ncbi:phosphoesterase [Desulfolithobacter sp.]
MKEEKVYTVRRRELEAAGILDGKDSLLAAVLGLPPCFLPRPRAETDPAFKQVIPYQVFTCGDSFFVFERGSRVGESRLSGRLSIGIGGHVNEDDSDHGQMTEQSFLGAMMRERNEELILDGPVATNFAGFINDDSDPVGQVHLGAVFTCQVRARKQLCLRPDSEDLHFTGWWTAEQIMGAKERFEKWSILALKTVAGQRKKIRKETDPGRNNK